MIQIVSGADSQLIITDKRNGMESFKNNMINCPSIITGMSHEMRTHMNAIVAFSYLMKENCNKNQECEEYSNQILNSCEQLIRLFESFLDSAIIDTGNSVTDSKTCKIDTILEELLSEFREILTREQSDLELITEIQYSNSTEVHIDKSRIQRVIRSLLNNSINNTNTGYIKVGYYLKDDKLIFYVLDSGQGYFKSKEFLQTEDLKETLSLHYDTYSALNMNLAKKIIKMLDGTIWIECNGLTGTGIYFSVPARVVSESIINVNKFINNMIAI